MKKSQKKIEEMRCHSNKQKLKGDHILCLKWQPREQWSITVETELAETDVNENKAVYVLPKTLCP